MNSIYQRINQPRGEGHHLSKEWRLKDPEGKSYRFSGLAEFLRGHVELFDPIDLEYKCKNGKTPQCRASRGLAKLHPDRIDRDGRPSWKGWTWDFGN